MSLRSSSRHHRRTRRSRFARRFAHGPPQKRARGRRHRPSGARAAGTRNPTGTISPKATPRLSSTCRATISPPARGIPRSGPRRRYSRSNCFSRHHAAATASVHASAISTSCRISIRRPSCSSAASSTSAPARRRKSAARARRSRPDFLLALARARFSHRARGNTLPLLQTKPPLLVLDSSAIQFHRPWDLGSTLRDAGPQKITDQLVRRLSFCCCSSASPFSPPGRSSTSRSFCSPSRPSSSRRPTDRPNCPDAAASTASSSKFVLATLLLDHTGEIGINSPYYPIYYLPVITAAIYFGPIGHARCGPRSPRSPTVRF